MWNWGSCFYELNSLVQLLFGYTLHVWTINKYINMYTVYFLQSTTRFALIQMLSPLPSGGRGVAPAPHQERCPWTPPGAAAPWTPAWGLAPDPASPLRCISLFLFLFQIIKTIVHLKHISDYTIIIISFPYLMSLSLYSFHLTTLHEV